MADIFESLGRILATNIKHDFLTTTESALEIGRPSLGFFIQVLNRGHYLRVLIDKGSAVVDLVVDYDVEILLGVVLSNILVGELLSLGHFEWRGIKEMNLSIQARKKQKKKLLEWKKLDRGRCMRRDGTTIVRGGGTRKARLCYFFSKRFSFSFAHAGWRATRVLYSGWYDWGVGSSDPAQPISTAPFLFRVIRYQPSTVFEPPQWSSAVSSAWPTPVRCPTEPY